jgi:hypothetical protein
MVVTLFKYNSTVKREKVLEARKKAQDIVKQSPLELIIAERGNGMGYHGITNSRVH